MFDDHWYQHTAEPVPIPKTQGRRVQETPVSANPPRLSQERAPSSQNKPPARTSYPDPPRAEVPARPKSQAGLYRLVGNAKTVDLDALPPRPKSRNDLEDLRSARYGWGRGAKGRGRPLELKDIRNELDFAALYEDVEDKLEDSGNSEYRLFHAILESHLTSCQYLISKTDQTMAVLNRLQADFAKVEEQTSSFQQSCASLVMQQNRLQSLADSVAANLQPFTELEPITRVLARPGLDFVTSPSFRDMLVRLDRCLEWMNNPAHSSFPDVESYGPRFRHCMTRALTLIREYFVSSMREVTGEVNVKMKERSSSDTTPSSLLYAKYHVIAPQLRELVAEIEKRCEHEEYISLRDECYSNYASTRQKLIVPIITRRMMELSNTSNAASKDLVGFARSAISFVRGICLDEFDLFHAYFPSDHGSGEIYRFLLHISQPLHDYLRPKINYESDILKLCELCALIQTRYMRDLDEDLEPYDRTQLDFGHLIHSPLQDTQARIVACAQNVIRDEIEYFTPKQEDLDYPAKCSVGKRTTASQNSTRKGPETPMPKTPTVVDGSAGEMFDTETLFIGWYPTLRKCIWLLSKIYRLLNAVIFDDIAHRIVHATTNSLIRASQLLRRTTSKTDSELFLLRHLLQLKSQLIAFDIGISNLANNQSEPAVSFAPSLDFLWSTVLSPRALFQFLKEAAMPKIVSNLPDAKQELDNCLRTVIEEFTNTWVGRMTESIVGVSNRLASADAKDPTHNVKIAVEREVPVLRKKVEEYFADDARTREMLVAAVQEQVISVYRTFWDEVLMNDEKKGDIFRPEGFAEWCVGIFGVVLAWEGEDAEDLGSVDGERSERSV